MTELMIIIKGIPYAEVEEWNRTRHLMMYVISPYTKQKIKANEILPLIIDDDYKEKEQLVKEISNEDVMWWNSFVESYKKEGK